MSSKPVPPSGRSEQVTILRDAIAHIEGICQPAASFGKAIDTRKVALGRDVALDLALGGGLTCGGLSEIVAARPGDAAAASGFALALAARFAASGKSPVLWIIEDRARAETGLPYAPGLAAHGLDPERLLVVRTLDGADSLWAMEEALKCRALAAVVLDLWRTKIYDLVASRRLVLAAGASGTPGILVMAGAPGTARMMTSAAQTRFEIAACPGSHVPVGMPGQASTRLPLPGRVAWAARLARIRAGPMAMSAIDGEKFWPLVWDHVEARFCDALPIPPPALSRDRPHPTQGDRKVGWRAA